MIIDVTSTWAQVVSATPIDVEGVVTHGPKVRARAFEMLWEGMSAREVGARLGVHAVTVGRWAKMAGMDMRVGSRGGVIAAPIDASPVKGHGGRLGVEHRMVIQTRLGDGLSLRMIAHELGVSPSTVSREIARVEAVIDGGYRARAGQALATQRRRRPRAPKLSPGTELRAEVARRLNQRHSPEQITARLSKDFPDRDDMQVSHETIYQALYVQGKGSLREELIHEKALRSGRTQRRKASRLPARTNRSWIGPHATITDRPAEASDRAVPGHWEGDLIIGKGHNSALITLAERSTRFVLIKPITTHTAPVVAHALIEMMAELPTSLARTLTWDQGSEMADHARFTLATGCPVYFCDPHSPWQRGTNENTNGLVRDYFPKSTDFTHVTDQEIQTAQDQLNTRPRKTLDWHTPTEKLAPLLVAATT